jgi:hypothetical protein
MNTDTLKTLLNLITEYGNCLTRIDGEKDMIKFIEARAVTECGVSAKAFKTVANAHHKDQASTVLDELNRQVDLFDEVRDMSSKNHVELYRYTTASTERGGE